jgi:hypothetical protein
MTHFFPKENYLEFEIFTICNQIIKNSAIICKENEYEEFKIILIKYVEEYRRLRVSTIFESLLQNDKYYDPLSDLVLPITDFYTNLNKFVSILMDYHINNKKDFILNHRKFIFTLNESNNESNNETNKLLMDNIINFNSFSMFDLPIDTLDSIYKVYK